MKKILLPIIFGLLTSCGQTKASDNTHELPASFTQKCCSLTIMGKQMSVVCLPNYKRRVLKCVSCITNNPSS